MLGCRIFQGRISIFWNTPAPLELLNFADNVRVVFSLLLEPLVENIDRVGIFDVDIKQIFNVLIEYIECVS